MAIDVTLKRYNGTSNDIIHPTTNWGQIEDKPLTYTPTSHTHDDRYYTETEVDNLLDAIQGSSNFTSEDLIMNFGTIGTPSEDVAFWVERGDSANVGIKWSETSDKWQFSNDGSNWNNILGTADVNSLISAKITGTATNGSSNAINSDWAYDHAASSTAHPRDTRNQIAGSYAAASHAHGNISSTGTLSTFSNPAVNDRLMIYTAGGEIRGSRLFTTGTTGFLREDGTFSEPDYTTGLAFSAITDPPTTLSGYGITDAADATHAHGPLTSEGKISDAVAHTIATGDFFPVAQAGAANLLRRPAITFNTSASGFLKQDGTWDTPTDTNTWRDITSSPSNGATTTSISADWAYKVEQENMAMNGVKTFNAQPVMGAGIKIGPTYYSTITMSSDDLYISNNNSAGHIYIRTNSTETSIQCQDNAGVYLYYNNVWKVATTSSGIDVAGSVSASTVAGTWVASQAEAEAGTVTNKVMTPATTKAAIEYIAGVGGSGGTWNLIRERASANTLTLASDGGVVGSIQVDETIALGNVYAIEWCIQGYASISTQHTHISIFALGENDASPGHFGNGVNTLTYTTVLDSAPDTITWFGVKVSGYDNDFYFDDAVRMTEESDNTWSNYVWDCYVGRIWRIS